MTNILIPTDFSPSSVHMASSVLHKSRFGTCGIVLFHAFSMPADAYDLLTGRRDPLNQYFTEEFRLACRQLKEQYGRKLNRIIVRTMIGDTSMLFRHYLDAHRIDLIYCPQDYIFQPLDERSVDPTVFFRQAPVPLVHSFSNDQSREFVRYPMEVSPQ